MSLPKKSSKTHCPERYLFGTYIPAELLASHDDREDDWGEATGDRSNFWLSSLVVVTLLLTSGLAYTYGTIRFARAWAAGVEHVAGNESSFTY